MVVYREYKRSDISNIISTLPEIITHIVKTNIKREEFVNLIFEICENCKSNAMAAIPPSMFTAKKIREARDMKVSNITTTEENSKYYRTKFMELNPVKYNSKLMNSIWGIYNRYSSHNVKKNNDVTMISSAELQQSAVNSANTESFRSLSPSPLDNVFVTISLPQSN